MLFINMGNRKRERCVRNKNICRDEYNKMFLYPCEGNYQEGTPGNTFLKFWYIGYVSNYFSTPITQLYL